MREIKFRAWDGERLRKVNTIGWVDEDVDFVTTPRYSGPAEDFILMQSTGLFDESGMEIFEGDVLKIVNGTTVVDFHYSTLYHIEHHPVMIIGNIYENPELLEREAE